MKREESIQKRVVDAKSEPFFKKSHSRQIRLSY